jgi:hypothetical protein
MHDLSVAKHHQCLAKHHQCFVKILGIVFQCTNKFSFIYFLKAVHYNQVSTAKYLLSMGCNVNLVDSFGYTAL